MQVIRAKSVVLATGNVNRLFGSRTMGWMFNNAGCPSDVCTGRAATYGHIAGVSAAEYAKKHSLTDAECMPVVAERAAHYSAILDREADTATPDWKEINIAIQQVMSDYCGPDVRSEHLLTTGLQHLRRIRKKAETMHCTGGHEFMRCLEAEDLGLLGELAFISALERKETRGKHNRVDYPFTNPLLNGKFVTIEKLDGGPVTGWRDKHK